MAVASQPASSSNSSRPLTVCFPPLRPQQRALFDARKRFNCWVCHRRFGKTVLSLYCLIHDAYACERAAPRFAYIAPLFRQAKSIAWDMLRTLLQPIPGVRFNEAELRADLHTGARIQLYGSDSPDTLRGLYFDGVVLDEAAQMRPRLWPEIVRPALADREGWVIHISTPLGHNAFYDLYQHAQADPLWHVATYQASATGIVPALELAAARAVMSVEQYNQEFEVSFEAALIGSYYGSYLDTAQASCRIGMVPWQSNLPVHTAWDLGVSDATAIWFVQPVGQMLHLIDYLEATDHGLEWYVRVLKDKPYVYGRHYFPHDIAARDWSQDGRTRLQIAESLGLKPAVVVPRGDIANGIQAVRTLFPRFQIDARACHGGLEALKAYRREWSETRRTWLEQPLHDWCLTGDTPVLTRNGTYQIMDLPFTGEVLTSCGWKAYHSPRITRKHAPLVGVVLSDGFMVRCTAEHLFKTESGWKSAAHLQRGTVIQSCSIPSRNILTVVSIACGQVSAILRAVGAGCITWYGKRSMACVRQVAISITAMGIVPTMLCAIWSVWTKPATLSTVCGNNAPEAVCWGSPPLPVLRRKPGTRRRKGASGIAAVLSSSATGPGGPGWHNHVPTVARRFWRSSGKGIRRSIVALGAVLPRITSAGRPRSDCSIFHDPVLSVVMNLLHRKPVGFILKSIAVQRAATLNMDAARTSDAKLPALHVVHVQALAERADVWCLTVPGLEEFALANGVLVHNSSHGASALATFAVGYEDPRRVPTSPTQGGERGLPSGVGWTG